MIPQARPKSRRSFNRNARPREWSHGCSHGPRHPRTGRSSDLRTLLLDYRDPDEDLLWTRQPGPAPRPSIRAGISTLAGMVCFRIFCIGPIVLGLGGIFTAIKLWAPGGAWPLIIQVAIFAPNPAKP